MSQLSKSLERRIQELTASIESQKIELAAYERVLHLESSKESLPAESVSIAPEVALAVSTQKKAMAAEVKSAKTTAPPSGEISYEGNKTALVAEIVKSHGSAGATPKDVDAYFSSKKIARSKNLVYNTLSYLVAHKKLVRTDGKYFALNGSAAPAKKTAAKKAVKTKRKLSPEGLKRIQEALKKRWAAKKAADAAAAKKK